MTRISPGARHGLASFVSGTMRHDALPAWGRLRQPALLVWGRNTQINAVETAPEWLALKADAELHVIDDALLLPHVEHAQEWNTLVLGWLETGNSATASKSKQPAPLRALDPRYEFLFRPRRICRYDLRSSIREAGFRIRFRAVAASSTGSFPNVVTGRGTPCHSLAINEHDQRGERSDLGVSQRGPQSNFEPSRRSVRSLALFVGGIGGTHFLSGATGPEHSGSVRA
jgi:hypothetical protein